MDLTPYVLDAFYVVSTIGLALGLWGLWTDGKETAKRLVLAFAVACVIGGARISAAEIHIPSAEECAAWAQTAWYTITYLWYLTQC